MNDQNDTKRGRVEGLLRQWGAGEEAGQPIGQRPEGLSVKHGKPRRAPLLLLRWAPVGIAAGLLLAASIVFLNTSANKNDGHVAPLAVAPDSSNAPPVPTTQPVDLSEELAEARKQASDARAALAEALAGKSAGDIEIKGLKLKADELTASLAKQALMEKTLRSLIIRAEQMEIDTRGELEKVKKQLALAQAGGVKADADSEKHKRLKARFAIAIDELKRQQETFRTAHAERDKAKRALARIKAHRQATLGQMSRIYLAAAAPGKTGLEALQEAMKRRGLLKQCIALQRRAKTDTDRKLLARTEVVLTRLGLLDASDSSAVSAFVVHLGRSDLIASLDALGPLTSDADAQDWVFETKLILTGVRRVI